jgi:inward rectifier potassium channel
MGSRSFDPGLTNKFTGRIRRIINEDGSFNVSREGVRLGDFHFYQWLITLGWPAFLLLVVSAYIIVNALFASIYVGLGLKFLSGARQDSLASGFFDAFFFSAQTLTTVGYGSITPKGPWTSIVASFEALVGLMAFALGAGLLYGRFSRPSAQILFSDQAIIAPYNGMTSLQFRIANKRRNMLTEIEAKILLMVVELDGNTRFRRYYDLKLEKTHIHFLPLTWTVVHPIVSESPLFEQSRESLEAQQAELLVLIRAFDDTFSQTVYSRRSYRYDEILWGTWFLPAFKTNEDGDLVLNMRDISKTERADA